jgi:hypothetical protein
MDEFVTSREYTFVKSAFVKSAPVTSQFVMDAFRSLRHSQTIIEFR